MKNKPFYPHITEIEDPANMKCNLNLSIGFHKCEVHNGSTYGCLYCGQFVKKDDRVNRDYLINKVKGLLKRINVFKKSDEIIFT